MKKENENKERVMQERSRNKIKGKREGIRDLDRTMWRNLLEEVLNLSSERILNDEEKMKRRGN
jgi:hypothetical protein